MIPVFVDEVPSPALTSNRYDRRDFVEALKTKPGQWAQYKPGTAHSISGASLMQHDYPGIKATYRKRPEGGYDIYAQWVGVTAPPVKSNQHNRRLRFVEILKTRPGEWAQYRPGTEHHSAVASTFRRDFPGVEARARTRGNERYDVYVRWVGP